MKIGHGPATVIGIAFIEQTLERIVQILSGLAESQEPTPNQSKLALFARKGAANRLAMLARLFYLGDGFGHHADVASRNDRRCTRGIGWDNLHLSCGIAIEGRRLASAPGNARCDG